jgi:hypothetical protein
MITHALALRRVDRYFRQPVSAAAATALRAHLGGCVRCRGRYQRNLEAEAALPEGEARAEQRLWQEIEAVAAAAARPLPSGRALLIAGALAAVVGAVVLAPRLGPRPQPPGGGGAVPRGGPPTGEARAPALHVFRSADGRTSEPLAATLRASDGLLFAYSNPGEDHRYLMVFGVDEAYDVHWFYPAWQRPADDPPAIAILPGGAGVELGEEIRHGYRPGGLRLFALFLDRPARVSEIEAAVARRYGAARAPLGEERALEIAGALQQSRLLEVTP